MKKKWIAAFLILVMTMCTACGFFGREAEEPVILEERPPVYVPDQPEEKEPELPPPPEWFTDPVLREEQMPGNYNGLELPVAGATGYTTIELPLWAEIEDKEAARLALEEWEKLQAELAAAEAAAEAAAKEAEEKLSSLPGGGRIALDEDGMDPSLLPPLEPEIDSGEVGTVPEAAGTGTPAVPEGTVPEAAGTGTPAVPEGTVPEAAGTGTPAVPGGTAPEAAGTGTPAVPGGTAPETSGAGTPAAEDIPAGEEETEETPTLTSGSLALLPPGTPMTVLEEKGGWWRVECEVEIKPETEEGDGMASSVNPESSLQQGDEPEFQTLTGWVEHKYCMINLPDVIPSIIYDATNTYSSRFVSCGKTIDGITGEALYAGNDVYNHRLDQTEFMMPVLYSMAPRLCAAQQAALKEGNTLVLYEAYRPHETQRKVADAMWALTRKDAEVKEAVTGEPWSMTWFISTGISNHQRGFAVDVSIARIDSVRTGKTGDYEYIRVQDFELYKMPTPIHELSPASATYVSPSSKELSIAMNAPALGLQGYCTGAGLSPLASEWWHFNDWNTESQLEEEKQGIGDFIISQCRSVPPGEKFSDLKIQE